MNSSDNTRTLLLLHLAVFLAGWTGIFGRLISLSGLPLVWYRMLVSVFSLLVVMLFLRSLHLPKGKNLYRICGCGFILAILPFLLQLHALRRLSAFTVNLAYNLEPVYSIAFAAALFGELRELDWSFWLGISLIIFSVVIQTIRVRNRDV